MTGPLVLHFTVSVMAFITHEIIRSPEHFTVLSVHSLTLKPFFIAEILSCLVFIFFNAILP